MYVREFSELLDGFDFSANPNWTGTNKVLVIWDLASKRLKLGVIFIKGEGYLVSIIPDVNEQKLTNQIDK